MYSEVALNALVDWAGWCSRNWSPHLHCLSHGKNWVYHFTFLGRCVIKWHNLTFHNGRLYWFLECRMCMTLYMCVIIITKIQLFFCKPLYLLNGVLLTSLNSGGIGRLSCLHVHVVNVYL